jgi:Arc/MetJ-type ribon-helix-helix transcriptional regulator
MANASTTKLERITITLPQNLVREVEDRIAAGHYATTTEWVRHAIREQLRREKSPMDLLIEKDDRVAKSLQQAREGQSVDIDLEGMIERSRKRASSEGMNET